MTRDEHEAQLRAGAWFTARQLAERWQVTVSTVYGLPRTDLPYVQLGTGQRRLHRRYSPEAVAAFEAAGGVARGVAA
jgi:hypothetical protein